MNGALKLLPRVESESVCGSVRGGGAGGGCECPSENELGSLTLP
jgi:hypothetical protein